MKTKHVILAVCLMGLTVSASAQKKQARGKGHQKGQLEQVTTLSGTITEWMYNDDFEYNSFQLNTGSATVLVKFPPHLAQQVKSLGSKLSVSGVLKHSRNGSQEMKMVSITGNGQTVHDQKPIRHTAPPQQEPFVSGEAKVSQMQISKSGAVSGYILDNGVVLRIPPRTAGQLAQMVQPGTTIGYTGMEKVLKQGHVRTKNYKIVRSQTISVNGTQYLVR